MTEIISLDKKIEWLIEDLKAYDPEKVILFGSSVEGALDQYSDLDVAIIKETDKRFLERLVEAAKLIRPQLHPIDIFVYTPVEIRRMEEESFFWEQIKKKGRVIYEKS